MRTHKPLFPKAELFKILDGFSGYSVRFFSSEYFSPGSLWVVVDLYDSNNKPLSSKAWGEPNIESMSEYYAGVMLWIKENS